MKLFKNSSLKPMKKTGWTHGRDRDKKLTERATALAGIYLLQKPYCV